MLLLLFLRNPHPDNSDERNSELCGQCQPPNSLETFQSHLAIRASIDSRIKGPIARGLPGFLFDSQYEAEETTGNLAGGDSQGHRQSSLVLNDMCA